MGDPAVVRAFLEGETAALETFDFVIVEPCGQPLHRVEVGRTENDVLEVRVPGRMPFLPALSEAEQGLLAKLGFANDDAEVPTNSWICAVDDAAAAASLSERLLQEVFNEKPGCSLDVRHGSYRAAHEAHLKLVAVRKDVEAVVTEVMGAKPEQDSDGDYVLVIGDVQVIVAPRVLSAGPAIVRVFAVTNVGVAAVPEVGLFLARLNFGLMFGRFALDVEHNSIWFDETLLGDQLNDEALKFTIQVVASTADEWDDRIKAIFGGAKFREVKADDQALQVPSTKPGEVPEGGHGLYL